MSVYPIHFLIAAVALVQVPWVSAQTILSKQILFEAEGRDVCQGMTLVESSKGTLMAAWRTGSERGPDGEVWLARFENGKWATPQLVASGIQPDGRSFRCNGASLFQALRGDLFLHVAGPKPDGGTWDALWMSRDDGYTWEKQPATAGRVSLRPGNPFQLQDGTMIFASSTENNGWRIHFDLSTDGGRRWTTVHPASMGNPPASAISPAIIKINDDTLQALARTKNGRIAAVTSTDRGRSWGHVFLTTLPNPSSSLDALTLRDGRHVVVYNHSERRRSPLNVAISSNGTDWEPWVTLENDPRLDFSFPAVVQTQDGVIHITHTHGIKTVKHVAISPGKSPSELSATEGYRLIQTDADQPRIEVIKDQGPNSTEWALTPLDEAIPADIRQNLTFLREDLLDEGKKAAKSSPEAYKLASDYCDKLLAALSQREIARVQAGYSAAQADANKTTSNQALDARRNHQMSWPQFSREESQRAALRESETNKADVKKQRLKVEWATRAEQMRLHLDSIYRQLREAMR
jgi:predicted neuraminidase